MAEHSTTGELSDKEVISSIHSIYKRFRIPTSLQLHMFRVASVGKLITNSWIGPTIDEEKVIAALLIHDLGNIVKITLDSPNSINVFTPEDRGRIDYWIDVKKETIEKYGSNDHEATNNMVKELKVNKELSSLVIETGIYESGTADIVTAKELMVKICVYSDLRVGFHGIISMKRRFEDLIC
jgi:hypothetical protein